MGSKVHHQRGTVQPQGPFGRGAGSPAPTRFHAVPVVSQLNPRGATASNYRDGPYNCAGAVAANLARMLGTFPHKSDADLINDLSRGRTTADGTTPDNLLEMVNEVGGQASGSALAGAYEDAKLNAHLAKGDKLIAQVGLRNLSSGTCDAHYVIVEGRDTRGDYVVTDPLNGRYTVTPAQLRQGINQAPGLGGMLIPVEPQGASAPEGMGRSPRAPVSSTAVSSVPPAPPALNPFTTTDARLAGQDTTFRPYFGDDFSRPHAPPRPRGGEHDAFVSHGPAAPKLQRLHETPRQLPAGTTPAAYAALVARELASRDSGTKAHGQALFSSLEHSLHAPDQQAYQALLSRYAQQPGIGQRIALSGYHGGA